SGLVYGDGAKNEAFGLATKHSDDDLLLQGWGGSKFDFDSNVDGPTQGWLVQSVVLKAGAFSHFLDGAVIQSGEHTFATDLKQLVIGAEIAGLGESELEVGAALIYDRALTEPERMQVESYLQTKYITGSGEANLLAAAVSAVDTAPEDPALLADAAPDASFNDSAPENAPHEAAGSGGDDMLYARSGGDWLDGGAGNDHLFDGQGSDTMIGGAGADEFVFHGNHNNAGERDLVADLNFADDDRLVFVEFDPGTFNPDDKNTVEEGAGASVLSVEGLLGLDDLSGVSLHRLGEAHALLRMDPDMGGASEIELMFGGASAAEFEMRWLGA
uniref:calcium-binding protein n=1 Tax=Paludibacillus litoralis TaxID=3133267 RepID=UPI0039B722AD